MLVQVGKRFVSEQREIDPIFAKAMKDLLNKSGVFQNCHEDFIRDLIVSCTRKEYAPNRYIMEEGTRGDSMCVLFKGVVEVSAKGRYVCKLRDGSTFGEASLLNLDSLRTASVRSFMKCDVAIIFRSTFHSILEKYPWEKKKFQRQMKAKLMESGQLMDMKDDINLEQQAQHCDLLRRLPFFAQDEVLQPFVAELAVAATSLWVRPGRVIIQEGDTNCDDMYALLCGAVEVTACGEFLGRLEHDLFGEIGILDLLDRRTANVVAATQCHCMKFSREVLTPVLAKHPEARVRLLERAKERLTALNLAIGAESEERQNRRDLGSRGSSGFGGIGERGDGHMFAASPIFKEAPLDFLHELSSRMTTLRLDAGRTIIQENQDFIPSKDFVYWIAEGRAELYKAESFVEALTEGAVFGDLSLFEGTPRQVTVRSKTKISLRQVRGKELQELMRTFDDSDVSLWWHEDRERRLQQLGRLESLMAQRLTPSNFDFMFLKLTKQNEEGRTLPVNEPTENAVLDMCRQHGQGATRVPKPNPDPLEALNSMSNRLPPAPITTR
mmetsp:Transcript_47985/g.104429  ORF Transcript_47985/g.104429 Transcript_47985/m.104429 type:complete len:553 (+) Transcript_47985:28-1686(+)|eukprot:CAMPEP_0170601266 /NCGR_PEP_ID=MMETSP0224-20130122/17770_1 /TAXON_ID=285029 /ORGANISM="Togula jolla, Strain CCCM 725" /LENGTH=552 /DNA_ID=CAMNT_0010926035 /DNA_START=28 /DNA_END=1686 /DNA_ORIENTATION=+